MYPLKFKVEAEFEKGKQYSVCLRGARRISQDDEYDIYIYTPEHCERPKELANIVNQNNYRFCDLSPKNWIDNYDETARSYEGLLNAMNNVYKDFDELEVVTILRFEIV